MLAQTLIEARVRQQRGKKALVVLPYVALCKEQTRTYEKFLRDAFPGKRARTAFGGERSPLLLAPSTAIIVATFESAWSLVQRMLALDTRLDDIFSCMFVDEVHMIGEDRRGHCLEMLLATFRAKAPSVQLLAASATVGNAAALGTWLDATVYQGTEADRPVPLEKHVVSRNGRIWSFVDGTWQDTGRHEFLPQLAMDGIQEGGGVLVFCASQREAVDTARTLSQCSGTTKTLEGTDSLADAELRTCVSAGAAFHHASLSADDKEWVERAFARGDLKILACTPTLAAGVNLPARRVIILHGYIGVPSNLLSATKIHQMAGRAGRTGFSDKGDCFLLECPKVSLAVVKRLMASAPEPVVSVLDMDRAVLESLAAARSLDVLHHVLASPSPAALARAVSTCVNCQLVVRGEGSSAGEGDTETMLHLTPTGWCVASAGCAVTEGLARKAELERMQGTLCLHHSLQACYACTVEPSFLRHDTFERRPVVDRCISLLGKDQLGLLPLDDVNYCVESARGVLRFGGIKQLDIQAARLVDAFALHHLVDGVAPATVAARFSIPPGTLDSMRLLAILKAESLVAMCTHLKWTVLGAYINGFKECLMAGDSVDVVRLAKIPGGPTLAQAKKLVAVGITTAEDLAMASDGLLARTLGWRDEDAAARAKLRTFRDRAMASHHSSAESLVVNEEQEDPLGPVVAVVKRGREDVEFWDGTKRTVVSASRASMLLERLVSDGTRVVSPDSKSVLKLLESSPRSSCIRDTSLAARTVGMAPIMNARDALVLQHSLPPPGPVETLDATVHALLMEIERRGFAADVDAIAHHKTTALDTMADAETQLGIEIDLNSPQDVARYLYDHLGLPAPPNRSTKDEILCGLESRHPAVKYVRRYRREREIVEGCDMILQHSDESCIFRPNFCMVSTHTGRIVTERPNIQCLPKPLRAFLKPVDPGYLIMRADYRQAELRILAHFCQDPQLMDILSSPMADPFDLMAGDVGISREEAKVLTYSLLYHGGCRSIAKKLDFDATEDAVKLRDAFFKRYPAMRTWVASFEANAEKTGVVEALGGRVRRFGAATPEVRRQYLNTLCQASCSHLLKTALVAVERAFPGSVLLCLHDELILQVPRDAAVDMAARVTEIMQTACPLRVPLFVKTSVTSSWC